MSGDRVEAESEVVSGQVTIPERIRRELDIEDGDALRWALEADGTVHVEIDHRYGETFASFEGYDGDAETDATTDHDAWGVE
ncbi:AbrB/MazE/SpoVT family DNA-binding domain-containing protein [Halomarina salina]|uniref:AbrB/MazE/SpoVT family DNA-binding domain-containing protein n=1 Tax=Halomarina salina TaxID=1872699 RepID=A0ABD5RTI5_9EURY|nr:AbrB/MazE/SpoVT family DNA-binding domain-containing protein [Halomarina salina]